MQENSNPAVGKAFSKGVADFISTLKETREIYTRMHAHDDIEKVSIEL